MDSVLLIGTANTRPDALGALFRATGDGDFEPAQGIPTDTGVFAITTHPGRSNIAYAATKRGLYKSNDRGESWTKLRVPSAPGEEFWSATVHPSEHETVFAGCSPVGAYRSDDGGESWCRVGSREGMPEHCDLSASKTFKHSRLMRIAFDPTNPRRAFGACETNGFIMSEDGGETWRDASKALIQLSEEHPELRSAIIAPEEHEGILDGHAVLVSPLKPGVVFYACRMGVFSTADLGKSWRNHDIGKFAPITYSRDIRIAAVCPNVFYLALSIASRSQSGALYRSDDVGETWRRADEPVTAISTIMSMGAHASDANKVIYITRGGQVHWSDDGAATWRAKQLPAIAGDGFCSAIL